VVELSFLEGTAKAVADIKTARPRIRLFIIPPCISDSFGRESG
jgi:hypothetical protein